MGFSKKSLDRRIKQHVKAGSHFFYASCQPGFEDYLKDEILQCGVSNIVLIDTGGVEFEASMDVAYRVCLCCAGLGRLIMRLHSFHAEHFNLIHKKLSSFPWELYVNPSVKLNFSISCSKSRLYHTGKLEDIFSDFFSSHLEKDLFDSDYLSGLPLSDNGMDIFVRVVKDIFTISIDCSGPSLYKRGYKLKTVAAPLRETSAALMLRAAGWGSDDFNILVDPMCGSGSFTAEGFFISSGIVPSINKDFAFKLWPVFKENHFNHIKRLVSEEFKSRCDNSDSYFFPSDMDSRSVDYAASNLSNIGFKGDVLKKDFFDLRREDFPEGNILMLLNPPYGKRISSSTDIVKLYSDIGKCLKHHMSGIRVGIIVPGIEAEKALGLSYFKKILFMNGGFKAAFLLIDI